jgi:hypothetical protein
VGLIEIFNSEECSRFIDNIAAQIMDDSRINIQKLALICYAKDKESLAPKYEAGKEVIRKINEKKGTSLRAYPHNLCDYYSDHYQKGFPALDIPRFDVPNLHYVLLTDNFNDGLLLRHADYFFSKFGPKTEVRVASMISYPNIFPFFEYQSRRVIDKCLEIKTIKKRPSFVGCVVDDGTDYYAYFARLLCDDTSKKLSFVVGQKSSSIIY